MTTQPPRLYKLLAAPDARRYVEQVGKSWKLRSFRDYVRSYLSGYRCVVVGSAPKSVIPPLRPDDRYVCMNASGWIVAAMGRPSPTLTVMTGWTMLGNDPVRQAALNALRGLQTDGLVLFETELRANEMVAVLEGLPYAHRTHAIVNSLERAAILDQVMGGRLALGPGTKKDDRPSNGCFAAALAIWADASEVVLSGFSLTGGHCYIDGDTPRRHLAGDRSFFSALKRYGTRVRTTSPDLEREFGLLPS